MTTTGMNNSEQKKTGEVLEDFSIQLEKLVKERTVQLEDAVSKLEKEVAGCKSVQIKLHQLSRVFRDAADSILIEDLSGTIIDMNREAEQSYGWSRDELIGKSIKVLLLPDRYQFAWQLRQQCLNGQNV